MANCRDIESKLAEYVDREQPSAERLAVDAHLQACPPCRARAEGEQVAHDLLCSRRDTLRGSAPADLRRRCAAQRRAPRGFASLTRRPWVPLSLAASLVLFTGLFLFFAWGNSVETYAAQLAADHLKCFQFPPPEGAAPDATIVGRNWQESMGWALKVAASAPTEQLRLLGVRRCGSSRGRVAHLLYKWRGQPLSVYVLNHRFDRTPTASHDHDVNRLGEHAIVWTDHDRTYAVIASSRMPDLQYAAVYVRRSIE